MTTKHLASAVLIGTLAVLVVLRADADRLKNATDVVNQMVTGGDKGIPASLFAKAKCAVVIPSVKKAALGIGGQYGAGYASCRKGSGWTAPASVKIEGGNAGLEIGGVATDVILLVMNDTGMQNILNDKFTFGANAGVAAGPVGREASAQTDATLHAGILAYSHSKGAFAGLALEGSSLHEDSSENKALYGKEISNKEILAGGVKVPDMAQAFIAALSKH